MSKRKDQDSDNNNHGPRLHPVSRHISWRCLFMFKLDETYQQLQRLDKLPEDGYIVDKYFLKDNMPLFCINCQTHSKARQQCLRWKFLQEKNITDPEELSRFYQQFGVPTYDFPSIRDGSHSLYSDVWHKYWSKAGTSTAGAGSIQRNRRPPAFQEVKSRPEQESSPAFHPSLKQNAYVDLYTPTTTQAPIKQEPQSPISDVPQRSCDSEKDAGRERTEDTGGLKDSKGMEREPPNETTNERNKAKSDGKKAINFEDLLDIMPDPPLRQSQLTNQEIFVSWKDQEDFIGFSIISLDATLADLRSYLTTNLVVENDDFEFTYKMAPVKKPQEPVIKARDCAIQQSNGLVVKLAPRKKQCTYTTFAVL